MNRIGYQRAGQIGLALLTLALIVLLAAQAHRKFQGHRLTIAAGSSTGGSYIVSNALKTVVERHNPKIKLRILETAGTVQNLNMVENGQADVATAQADVPAGPSARSVAVLYDDVFQLVVHEDSPIRNFADLRGKVIALARGGGQFDSFLRVADHFKLSEKDFRFTGANDADADRAFSCKERRCGISGPVGRRSIDRAFDGRRKCPVCPHRTGGGDEDPASGV